MTEMYNENLILIPSFTYEITDCTSHKTLNKDLNCHLFPSDNLYLSNQDLSSILYRRFSPPETDKLSSAGLVFALMYCSKVPSTAYLLYFPNSDNNHQIKESFRNVTTLMRCTLDGIQPHT
jgi:hypothetical protein